MIVASCHLVILSTLLSSLFYCLIPLWWQILQFLDGTSKDTGASMALPIWVSNYLLSDIESCFWKKKGYSLKSEGNLWQSEGLCIKKTCFCASFKQTAPSTGLKFLPLHIQQPYNSLCFECNETGIPFCLKEFTQT